MDKLENSTNKKENEKTTEHLKITENNANTPEHTTKNRIQIKVKRTSTGDCEHICKKLHKIQTEGNKAEEQTSECIETSMHEHSTMDCLVKYLNVCLQNFSESNKTKVVEIFEKIKINEYVQGDMHKFLQTVDALCASPYFYFVNEQIKEMLFNILKTTCKVNKQHRLHSFEILTEKFPAGDLLHLFMQNYNSIENIRTGNTTFKNNCLLKCYERMLAHDIEEAENTSQPFGHTLGAVKSLGLCISFVEYLTRHIELSVCRSILLLACYSFLAEINTDLLELKTPRFSEDVDDFVVSRVFSVFSEMKTAFERNNSKIEEQSKEQKNKEAAPVGYESRDGSVEIKSATDIALTVLRILFGPSDSKAILFSIYKRLFFYFIHRNKRMHQTGKVFNVFSKEERLFIYKHVHKQHVAFVNIFAQIDQRYLLKEALKTDTPSKISIERICQIKLNNSDLSLFYKLFFDYVERTREEIKVKVENTVLFSEQFNKRLDKTFVKYIEIEKITIFDLKQNAVLLFLCAYTAIRKNTRVDVVTLVSLIVDTPDTFKYKETGNAVLRLLANTTEQLNPPLVKRLVPVLRRLLLYSEYVASAGWLYNRIYRYFKLVDPTFTQTHNELTLEIKGSIGHVLFESTFKECLPFTVQADSLYCSFDKLVKSSLASSLVFYLSHSHSFSMTYSFVLLDVLSYKQPATACLLVYLRENVSLCSSFISESLQLLYDLYAYLECSNGVVFPYRSSVLELFLNALKEKIVLPCMVIPYILIHDRCHYVYRNNLENSLNCINDCLQLATLNTKMLVAKIQGEEQTGVVDEHQLSQMFDLALQHNFLFEMCRKAGIHKVLEKIDYQNDFLRVFLVLRMLRDFNKQDKGTVISHIMENCVDEKVIELVERAREVYMRNSRAVLPVSFIG